MKVADAVLAVVVVGAVGAAIFFGTRQNGAPAPTVVLPAPQPSAPPQAAPPKPPQPVQDALALGQTALNLYSQGKDLWEDLFG